VEKFELTAFVHGEQAVVAVQLSVDVFKVLAYRASTDPSEPGDLVGAQALRDKGEDVQFTDGQTRALAGFLDLALPTPADGVAE
jgi:hypothetical protein